MAEESLYDHADLYDLVMADVAPAGQADFYLRQAQARDGPVLELACGTGRLTLPIAAAGVDTTGLDASAVMLAEARRKTREAGLTVGLIHGDMRSFDLGRRYRMIFVGAHSLHHLTDAADLVACFSAIGRHLEKEGAFVFDIFNPDPRILARDKLQRFPVGEYRHERLGRLTLDETTDYDPASQVSRVLWYFSAGDQRDSLVVPLLLRSIFPQELPLLLNAGGLRIEQRFGDFSGGPFDGRSRHQICVCRPAAWICPWPIPPVARTELSGALVIYLSWADCFGASVNSCARLLALTGCVSVNHYDDDDGYYRCHGGRCYYHHD